MFLPFSGCKERCVFCAQDRQTGKGERSVFRALAEAGKDLDRMRRTGASAVELAFYGGTFTALAARELDACLDFALHWRSTGQVAAVRCSTRPDALSPALFARLRAAGFHCIELGVQSFTDAALRASRRGYDGGQAEAACRAVREAGFALGVQLLPGMPGLTQAAAREDVRRAAALAPTYVRLYPCLVLEGTALAEAWRRGDYAPWGTDATLDYLAFACLAFWRAGAPIIRIGLAENADLEQAWLAGPRHAAMGNRARALALYRLVRERVTLRRRQGEMAPLALRAPRRFQGEFWGWRRELESLYTALGLPRQRVFWWDEPYFALCRAADALPANCME